MSLDQTRAQLQELLRQIFQFDAAAELDHGIYRVIRQRQEDVKEFIEQSLPSRVERLLAERRDELQGDMRANLESLRQRVIDTLGPDALDAAGELESTYHQTRIGKDYREARRRVAAISAGEQREIALYFRTLRRDGRSTLAIYADLLRRIFDAPAPQPLRLLDLKRAPGEIGLQAGDNSQPFGVIYIGDAPAFLDLANTAGLRVAPDRFTASLLMFAIALS